MIYPFLFHIIKTRSYGFGRCTIGVLPQDGRGRLITFEGIEGSGKTTQMGELGAYLAGLHLPVRLTREPGGTPIGDAIRAILLRPDNTDMDPRTELLLIAACRAQHVAELLRPCLDRGEIILCDRFSDATMAYQGYGRGLGPELVRRVNETSARGLTPDLTLLLDCPVRVGLERSWRRLRAQGKAGEESRFEKEEEAFHERVRAGYRQIAVEEPRRVKVVDASAPPQEVQRTIRDLAREWLGL